MAPPGGLPSRLLGRARAVARRASLLSFSFATGYHGTGADALSAKSDYKQTAAMFVLRTMDVGCCYCCYDAMMFVAPFRAIGHACRMDQPLDTESTIKL